MRGGGGYSVLSLKVRQGAVKANMSQVKNRVV